MLSGLETFENRKKISFIGHWLMAWLSKKQNFISLSIIEAKYIVVGICSLLQKLKLMTLYFMTLSKSVIIEGIQ